MEGEEGVLDRTRRMCGYFSGHVSKRIEYNKSVNVVRKPYSSNSFISNIDLLFL